MVNGPFLLESGCVNNGIQLSWDPKGTVFDCSYLAPHSASEIESFFNSGALALIPLALAYVLTPNNLETQQL